MKENKKVQHNLDLSGKTIVNARLVNCKITLDDGTVVTLAEILSEIVDAIPSGETPRPIVLTAEPESGETTQSSLDAIGLPVEEIQAASRGERTGVVLPYGPSEMDYYTITYATYSDELNYEFVFVMFKIIGSGGFDKYMQYYISASEGNITVSFEEV